MDRLKRFCIESLNKIKKKCVSGAGSIKNAFFLPPMGLHEEKKAKKMLMKFREEFRDITLKYMGFITVPGHVVDMMTEEWKVWLKWILIGYVTVAGLFWIALLIIKTVAFWSRCKKVVKNSKKSCAVLSVDSEVTAISEKNKQVEGGNSVIIDISNEDTEFGKNTQVGESSSATGNNGGEGDYSPFIVSSCLIDVILSCLFYGTLGLLTTKAMYIVFIEFSAAPAPMN